MYSVSNTVQIETISGTLTDLNYWNPNQKLQCCDRYVRMAMLFRMSMDLPLAKNPVETTIFETL